MPRQKNNSVNDKKEPEIIHITEDVVPKTENLTNTVSDNKLMKCLSKNKIVVFISILIIFIVLFVVVKQQIQNTKLEIAKTQQKPVVESPKDLLAAVSKHIILPNGDPAIFVIQDPATLITQQPFFVGAQKDDRLLVYTVAGKAIIYSPSRDILVNVGPVTFDQTKDEVGLKKQNSK